MRSLSKIRKKLVEAARMAYDRGLVSATGGNLSFRFPNEESIIIKPSNVSFRDLEPENLLVMDFNGRIIDGMGKPSKEWRFHVGIYKTRRDVNSVLHVHPPATTTFSIIGEELPLLTAQSKLILKRVPIVKFAPPGSKTLAELVKKAFIDRAVKAALLERHGAVAVGRDPKEALNNADLLEETAKIALLFLLLKRSRR
jgi:L-fuculose-phosphate aldolase